MSKFESIQFIDLGAQRLRLGASLDRAVERVLNRGDFVSGLEVTQLESELCSYTGAKHAVTCSSGTDALLMALMACGVGPGDAVICPSFTFCATAEVVALRGATPIFVDVDEDTFNIDANAVGAAAEMCRRNGLVPKAVIPVDLFGQPAAHSSIAEAASAENIIVVDDAAQGFGGTYQGKKLGTFGKATATSFFPAKPLGCYGDGGAILTDDAELAGLLRSIRVHGQGASKYDNVRLGLTARLDTLQAAILLEKLKIFDEEIAARNEIARRYSEALGDKVDVPRVAEGNTSVWAQYTIRLRDGINRDAFADALKKDGIPTMVYYPRPLHQQPAYRHYSIVGDSLPVSEALSKEVISLPMHPYLEKQHQNYIIERALTAVNELTRTAIK